MFTQLFTTSVMAFQQFLAGAVFGYSAVILPQLQQPDSLIQPDADEASWIGMCIYIYQYGILYTQIVYEDDLLNFFSQLTVTVMSYWLYSFWLFIRQNRPEEFATVDVHPNDSGLDTSQQRAVLRTHLHRKTFGRISNW